jgi:hypothetical protein
MKRLLGVVALLLVTAGAAAAADDKDKQNLVPVVRAAEPATVRAGAEVVVTGEALDAGRVAAIYLTDGKNDVQVVVVEQKETLVRFKVPEKIAPGRYFVMLLAKLDLPTLLEQPVAIRVEAVK